MKWHILDVDKQQRLVKINGFIKGFKMDESFAIIQKKFIDDMMNIAQGHQESIMIL